ncbi:MAG TPA: hypothetical protein VFE05_00590 [Longimicrobiaceae bacterium]|jgi:hypothetical protein|nr:hypothetical protein [Longimicrobiaceae bacterium]
MSVAAALPSGQPDLPAGGVDSAAEARRSAPVRSDRRQALGAMLAGMAVGGGFAGLLVWAMGPHGILPAASFRPAGGLAWAVTAVAAWLAATLLHEGGHAAGAALGGFRLIALWAGPLRIGRVDGRLRAGLNRRLAAWGGACLSAPDRWPGDAAFRRGMWRYVAGGPAGSVAGSAACLAGAVAMSSPWALFLFVTGAMSLGLAVVTSIPMRMGGGTASDGLQLRRLRRRGADDEAQLAIRALLLLAQTQRPREWDAELAGRAEAAAGVSELGAAASYLLYYRALDLGDWDAAREHLGRATERAASGANGPARAAQANAALEAAIFTAAWENDAEAGRRWLDQASAARGADPQGWSLALAAIARAEGKPPADDLADAARAARRTGIPSATLLRAATVERLSADARRSAPA